MVEDNILADGLQPSLEYNGGGGNAFFANFTTNNLIDFNTHGPHPLMNLFEQNHVGTYPVVTAGPTTNFYGGGLLLDGYFGGVSHQTFFRNAFTSNLQPLALKRWSSYCQIVGNVIGRTGAAFLAFMHDTNGVATQCIELGRPNIGNNDYVGTNPPIPWNFPGHWVNTNVNNPNGIFAFTNNQGPTNILYGNFTNTPEAFAWVIFQDPVNTNLYHPLDGISVVKMSATESNLTINREITVTNGWRVYFVGQSLDCYKQLITTNRETINIHGNYSYYTNGVQWDAANADHNLPDSYLYASAPSWWGTNRWPAIDPEAGVKVQTIPAELRYNGIVSEGEGDEIAPTVTITGPTSSPTYSTSTAGITISGTATDETGLDRVSLVNNGSGLGNATGTTTWSKAVTLTSGANVIVVTAYDTSNNTATDTITITYTPDSETPSTGPVFSGNTVIEGTVIIK